MELLDCDIKLFFCGIQRGDLEVSGTDSSSAGIPTPLAFCRLHGHPCCVTRPAECLESVMASTGPCKKKLNPGLGAAPHH